VKICHQSCSFGVLGFLWDLIQVLDMPRNFDYYYKGITIVDVAHADHTFQQLQQFKSLSLSIRFDHTWFESQVSNSDFKFFPFHQETMALLSERE